MLERNLIDLTKGNEDHLQVLLGQVLGKIAHENTIRPGNGSAGEKKKRKS